MDAIRAGQILIVDWRDAMPSEANKLRPSIVVEDSELFAPSFPNVLVVPISTNAAFAIPQLMYVLEPTIENGCSTRCFVLSHSITAISKLRIKEVTASHITDVELWAIRRQCAECIGIRLGT